MWGTSLGTIPAGFVLPSDCSFFAVKMKPRTPHLLGLSSATELHPSPLLIISVGIRVVK